MLVALLAAVAGVFFGRATKTGKEAGLSPAWQSLPKAPIAGRIGAGVVWTGKKMIVWGGYARSENAGQAADGAAYDPATRTWRTIAPSPAGVQGDGGAGVVWTGDAMVVWASSSPDGPVGAAVYNPRTNTWRRLPAGPLGIREGYASVWTGKELLVIGGYRGDGEATPIAAAVNPRPGVWRLLPAFDHVTFFGGPNGAVWNGHEAFVAGNLSLCPERGSACDKTRPILVAYNPATDTVREIKLPAYSTDFGADTAASLKPIGWTGTDVVFSTTVTGSVRIVRYNPTTGVWTKGTYAPCYIPFNGYTQTAWIGDRYVAACGGDGLQIYSLVTDSWTWRTITPGPSPLNSREGSAIVWTGTQLIAWSGTVYKPFNPTPNDGASLTLKN
ncbi:MAG: hypothetical protein ACXVFF_12150 [Gaiellaceae bacterium]